MSKVHLGNIRLAIRYLSKGLEDLFSSVLIFSDVNYKADELFKGNVVSTI
jgi:hypothetical protein